MFEPFDLGAGAAVAFFLLCVALMAFSRPRGAVARSGYVSDDRSRNEGAFRKPIDR
jgi:hypothetical protein